MNSESAKDHTIISWKAPEFHFHKKSQWWFPIQAFITLALTVFFILTEQYVVAIIIILGASILYRLAHQEPEVLPVIFSPSGLKFKGQSYLYSRLKSFWIVESGRHHRLHLQPVDRFAGAVAIPMSEHDVEKVRDFLGHYLPEKHGVTEDLADRLNRWLQI